MQYGKKRQRLNNIYANKRILTLTEKTGGTNALYHIHPILRLRMFHATLDNRAMERGRYYQDTVASTVYAQYSVRGELMINIFHMDCMIAMAEMPDTAYDLCICDPPYGIGESMNDNASRGNLAVAKDYGKKEWDKQPPPIKYFTELCRVSNNQIIWGAHHFISHIPIDSPCWIVWDKVNYGNDFADCELAWTSFNSAVRKFTFQWNGMLQGDMRNKEFRIHPTQKPVKLYEWLLKNYAKPGDKILDTHLGSGSSAIACYNLDFDFTGYEIDAEYFNAAVNRLEQHKKQQRLFDGVKP